MSPLLNYCSEAYLRVSAAKIFCLLASILLIGTLCAGQPTNHPPEPSPAFEPLPEGRFGQAYDGRQISITPANATDAYRVPPLTVECWANLESPAGFNIIAVWRGRRTK